MVYKGTAELDRVRNAEAYTPHFIQVERGKGKIFVRQQVKTK